MTPRALALLLLLAWPAVARGRQPSEEERRLQAIAIDSRAAGRRDVLDGKEFAPQHVSASEREEVAWQAGYEAGWADGRLEIRRQSGGHLFRAGLASCILGTIGMAVMAASLASRSPYDDVFPSGYATLAGPIGALELVIGVPLFIGGIVRMVRAEDERRLLDDPEREARRTPKVAPLLLRDGGGLALSGSF